MYRFSNFRFDPARGLLHGPEGEQHVRHKVAQLMEYLIEHRDRVISKEELLSTLWEQGDYRENSLTQSVREARKLLGDSAQQPRFIRNYPQRGYQWIAPLEALPLDAPSVSEPQADMTAQVQPAPQPKPSLGIGLTVLTLVVLMLGAVWFWQPGSAEEIEPGNARLVVMPFINDTGDSAMNWVEMGLSDMLAENLASNSQLSVSSPASAHNMMALDGVSWPPKPAQLQQIMKDRKIDLLLMSRVSRYRDKEVLSIELYRRDGRIDTGAITYPRLSVAINAVAAQLQQLINPEAAQPAEHKVSANPASVQDFVRGLQALHQQGPLLAVSYFNAARLQDDTNHWAGAYQALSWLQLGKLKQAKERFEQLSDIDEPRLSNFICRWLGEIAYRRGNLTRAEGGLVSCASRAEASHDRQIQYQSYRLLAQIAHQRYEWEQFRQWNAKAAELAALEGDMGAQAEVLFYLGSPVESGLEKDPANDLTDNGEKLRQALGYYQQLGNQPRIAAARFALAQNYYLPLAEREAALQEAIMLWRQLEMPFELAQALTYQGFYQLQLHQGAQAIDPLDEALKLSVQLEARWLNGLARFYRAFADFDRGLSASGGVDQQQIQASLQRFDRLLADSALAGKERADAQVISGWALSAIGQQLKASERLRNAGAFYRQHQMDVSSGYSLYSQMWNALQVDQLDQVLLLGEQPISTRMQLRYLAEAQHRKGMTVQAAETFGSIAEHFEPSWTEQDQQILQRYQRDASSGLGPLPTAWSVYCESDWALAPEAL